jgi:uncharacterized protein YraI
MRSGPGTSYDKIGSAPAGTNITVVGPADEDPEWSKCIMGDGTEYYLKNEFLTD